MLNIKCCILCFFSIWLTYHPNINASSFGYYDSTDSTLEDPEIIEPLITVNNYKYIVDFIKNNDFYAISFGIVSGDLIKEIKLHILTVLIELFEKNLSLQQEKLREFPMDRAAIKKIFMEQGKLGFIVEQNEILKVSALNGDREIVIAAILIDIDAARKIIEESMLIQLAIIRNYKDTVKYLKFVRDESDNEAVSAYLKSIKIDELGISYSKNIEQHHKQDSKTRFALFSIFNLKTGYCKRWWTGKKNSL